MHNYNDKNLHWRLIKNLIYYTGKLIKQLNKIIEMEPLMLAKRIGAYLSTMYQIFLNFNFFGGSCYRNAIKSMKIIFDIHNSIISESAYNDLAS